MRSPSEIAEALQKLLFYEWAYGRLAEQDDGLGPLGEFVVGLRVGGIEGRRPEIAPVDLVASDGTTWEVKTSGGPVVKPRQKAYWAWRIAQESDALEGRSQLADRWAFLRAQFPPRARRTRLFDPFDPKWWSVAVLTSVQLRAAGVHDTVTEGTLRAAQANFTSLDALGPASAEHPVLLRLRFFRWAYGDLSAKFNFGRLAEFQVMRVCGMPTLARRTWSPVDLVARNGRTLEVKASNAPQRTGAGVVYHRFPIPVRRVRNASPDAPLRPADYFVFAWTTSPDPSAVPMAPGKWRFMLVPSHVLGAARTVRSTKLMKLGYPVLTATELRAALSAE